MISKIKIKKRHIIFFIALLIVFFFGFMYITNNGSIFEEKIVREAAVAGTWYPGEKDTLTETINTYYTNTKDIEVTGNIKAIIVPHAGYIYSGQVAAEGFNHLKNDYKKVFIIASNHANNAVVNGISIPEVTHYKTPLGEVKVSKIAKELKKENLFITVPESHTTHVIEIELPFLQTKLKDFEIIPMITGRLDINQINKAADLISKYLDDDTLIVVSSDLSHYHPYDEAVNLDTSCINNIESMNFEESAKCEACGLYAIFILMEIAKNKGWNPKIIDYKNSGDTAGSKDRVVGYSSLVFTENGGNEEELTHEEKEFLLKLARNKLESIFTKEKVEINEEELTPALKNVQGCFSTLNKNYNLRGCIGHILPQEELYKCVQDNIQSAALYDRRFQPVTQDELKDIEIEISVLTVPKRLEFSSGEDLLNKLRPMVDGVVLKSGFAQSTYLPQVWESFPTKESFLTSLCQKGGAKADCWKDTKTEVYTYQALVFDESELE